MQIGSFLDNQLTKNVTYSYYHRGMNTPYPPDDMQESEECAYYTKEYGNLFFDRPVSWKNTVLLQGGIDILISLGERCFVDHVILMQTPGARPASVEIFTLTERMYKKIGFYLPESGKLISAEELSVSVGCYCDNVIIRLNADCMPVGISSLDILGAWDMEQKVWPTPLQAEYREGRFLLKELKRIQAYGEDERFAAEYLCKKMKEKTGFWPEISEKAGEIVFCMPDTMAEGKDSYHLEVKKEGCLVEAANRRGLLYAVDTMLQRMDEEGIKCCHIEDEAFMEFRGVHIALPDKKQLSFLKKLVKYVFVPMRYNMVFIEIAGAMQYEKYPEISKAWENACEKYEKGEWPKPPHYGFLSRDVWKKSEVTELCEYMAEYGLEVVPEVQCFSHSQYITMAYPELAEKIAVKKSAEDTDLNEEDAMPDKFYPPSLCPSHPEYYKTVFGIIDEVLEAVRPVRFIHMGHDELWELGKCSKCSKISRADIFAGEVTRINDYVKSKKLRMMMWSDMLQPRGHCVPNAINKIPKDIIMMDFVWYFFMDKEPEVKLLEHGFQVIMGNMYSSHYPRFEARAHRKGILGAEVSAWVACNELSYGFEGKMFDLVYSAECMWNSHYRSDMRLTCNEMIKPIMKETRDQIGDLHCSGAERSISVGGKREHIPYDIRDMVPYSGAVAVNAEQISEGIFVGDHADVISFVHATNKNSERIMWKEPLKIGEYVLCYEDGSEYVEDILYAANIYKYLAPFGDRITSTLSRHEGYIGTYFTVPECGKTHDGRDYTLGKYSIRNPYSSKLVTAIKLNHCGNTDAEILLFDVVLYGGEE